MRNIIFFALRVRIVANPFVLDINDYKRDLNLPRAWVRQNSLFVSIMTGKDREHCSRQVRKLISRPGRCTLKDPSVLITRQASPGNRVRDETTFIQYIDEVVAADRILSPSMVCYENPKVIKSPSAKFVEGGIKDRKKAKKEEFIARIQKNDTLRKIKNAEQNAKKIGINSLSGMHGFGGNILYIKSGHPSLTSTCRAATSYGNGNNERLLAGSRHYFNDEIALANMLSLIDNTDLVLWENTINRLGLVYPTLEQLIDCIHRSTDLYWRNDIQFNRLISFMERLSPVQRAVIVYTGDLYHLAKYNDQFVRTFFSKIVDPQVPVSERVLDDWDEVLRTTDSDTLVLGIYLNADLMRGTSIDDLRAENRIDALQQVAWSAKNVLNVRDEYFDFIRVFLTPTTLTPTAANIKELTRRVVLASDTDSTIFTTQEWVEWYTGNLNRGSAADGVWYFTTYIACQCVVHCLAMLSTNMGVIKEELFRLAMKNEFAFDQFARTQRAKHYYANRSAQEGNVYTEPDLERKGVALRSSAVATEIIDDAAVFMKEILQKVNDGEQFELKYLYQRVWEHEQAIKRSIEGGEYTYLKTGQIKANYKNLEESVYRHFLMWNEVFAPDYGEIGAPPYTCVKVPMAISNKTEMQEWMTHCEKNFPEFHARMSEYIKRTGRDIMSTHYLPQPIVAGTGMPKELLGFIDLRRLTAEILESFYMLLESVGIYQIDENHVRLISDIYTPSMETSTLCEITSPSSSYL